MSEILIDSLSAVFRLFSDCVSSTAPIYRGHGKKEYLIESSAVRRLQSSYKVRPTNAAIIDYHVETLLEDAKSLHYHHHEDGKILSDIELLAKLQHQGAATSLLDFTRNISVALWFACGDLSADGAVFVIEDHTDITLFQRATLNVFEKSLKGIFEETTDKLYIWEPPGLQTRIQQQDSIFVFGLNESVLNERAQKFIIAKDIKQDVLDVLKKAFNVELKTLFKDFDGFALANSQAESLAGSRTEKLFLRANEYFQEARYDEAEVVYKQVLHIDPMFHQVLPFLGQVDLIQDRIEGAIDWLQQAVDANPNDRETDSKLRAAKSLAMNNEKLKTSKSAKIYCAAGNDYLKLEQIEKATQSYGKAIAANPGYAEAYFRLGIISATKKRRSHEAIRYYSKAIEINPVNWKYYLSMSLAYEEIGEVEQAKEFQVQSENLKKRRRSQQSL